MNTEWPHSRALWNYVTFPWYALPLTTVIPQRKIPAHNWSNHITGHFQIRTDAVNVKSSQLLWNFLLADLKNCLVLITNSDWRVDRHWKFFLPSLQNVALNLRSRATFYKLWVQNFQWWPQRQSLLFAYCFICCRPNANWQYEQET